MKDLLTSSWHSSIKEISKEQWKNLTRDEEIPFFQWDWLNALECSESISSKYGWQPLHISLWENDRIIAFAPLYLKSHSYGEFIFDQEFARLAEYLGLSYYPKLLGMSPLSPIEGYKFFIAKDKDERELTKIILKTIETFAIKNKILSCNFLYVDPIWKKYLEEEKYSVWINKQTLWSSEGENNFDDYLERFNANQRRNIKRERRSIEKLGILISTLEGDKINSDILKIMHQRYEMHCAKWGDWGSKYLTEEFFKKLEIDTLKEKLVLFNANRGDPQDPIALSLCIRDSDMLWGRYWGSKEEIPNLHFETCYYAPISWAISNGVEKFDPGAGGSHKLRRGFAPTPRFSLHRWYNKGFEEIMQSWLPKANKKIVQAINASKNEAPFKALKENL